MERMERMGSITEKIIQYLSQFNVDLSEFDVEKYVEIVSADDTILCPLLFGMKCLDHNDLGRCGDCENFAITNRGLICRCNHPIEEYKKVFKKLIWRSDDGNNK